MIKNVFELLDLLLIALASWRLSYMLVNEDGNMSITYAIRLIGGKPVGYKRFEAWKMSLTSNAPSIRATNNFGKMLSCIWCTSVTVSFFWMISWRFYGESTIFQITTLSFALAALVLIVNDKM